MAAEANIATIQEIYEAFGREASFHLHHYFRFDPERKIVYYRGSEDSAQVADAVAG